MDRAIDHDDEFHYNTQRIQLDTRIPDRQEAYTEYLNRQSAA